MVVKEGGKEGMGKKPVETCTVEVTVLGNQGLILLRILENTWEETEG